MNQFYKEDDWKMQLENKRKDQSIYGTINLTFKFNEDYQLEYKLEDCMIEDHNLKIEDIDNFVCPEDLNIIYCYSNDKGEDIKLDIQDYEIDEISEHNRSYNYQTYGTSSFFVQYLVISPNHQFIFICVHVKILNELESYRMIVIDIKNQKMKKLFYRNHFIGYKKPYFSKAGNVAFLDISKDGEGSRYLFFDLKNGIQKISIFQFDYKFWRIDYDDQSQCLFYITQDCKIIQQPINFENFTIDKSKREKFKINPILNEYLNYSIRLYLLYDSNVLIVDELGQFIVTRIRKNYKVIRNYLYESYYPVSIFSKAFVVMNDYDQNTLLFMDVSKGKLLRKSEFTQGRDKYYYAQNESYYISYSLYSPRQESSDFLNFQKKQLHSEERKIWFIFDFIRGIQKQVQKTKLTQEKIKSQIFTQEMVVQSYQNKISFKLKL